MMNIPIKVFLLGIFTLFISTIGCQDSVTQTQPETSTEIGQIQFIHSATSASELDLAIRDLDDNQLYSIEYETSYGHQYGYYDVLTGERELKIFLPSSNIAVAGVTVTVEKGQKYKLIAYDLEATINPELLVLTDTLVFPGPGATYVRFLHTGIDIPAIQISEKDSSEILCDLSWLESSNYLELQNRTYHFKIVSPQTKETILEVEPITFLSGQIYGIIFSGSTSGITAIDFNAKVYRETSI
jgi:hypothetical protein